MVLHETNKQRPMSGSFVLKVSLINTNMICLLPANILDHSLNICCICANPNFKITSIP